MPASECMSIRVLSHVYHSAFMHLICHAYCAVHVCPCTATRCVYLRHRCVYLRHRCVYPRHRCAYPRHRCAYLRHHASGPALSTVLPPRVWALSTVLRSQYGVAATGTASTRPAAAGKCGEFRRPWCGMKRAKQTLLWCSCPSSKDPCKNRLLCCLIQVKNAARHCPRRPSEGAIFP